MITIPLSLGSETKKNAILNLTSGVFICCNRYAVAA